MRGGLADHTERLAIELAGEGEVALLTSAGTRAKRSFSVHAEIRDWQNPTELLRVIQKIDPESAVLWQYVPHMYGRGGVNFGLAKVMAALRQQARRQFVIAHEIAAPLSIWPQRLWYALAHRQQWRQILRHADAIGISTEAWLEEWSRRTPQFSDKFCLLPSPSSIPVVPVAADHAAQWRRNQGLSAHARVLAYFGTISGTKQFDWVLSAWQQAQTAREPVALVVIGELPPGAVPPELESLFKPLGYLSSADVSAALQAVDVLALPYIDGVSERRTSFMTGLSHGCAIVTTLGANTGSSLRRADYFVAAAADDPAGYRQAASGLLAGDVRKSQLGKAGRLAYESRYDWSHIARVIQGRWP